MARISGLLVAWPRRLYGYLGSSGGAVSLAAVALSAIIVGALWAAGTAALGGNPTEGFWTGVIIGLLLPVLLVTYTVIVVAALSIIRRPPSKSPIKHASTEKSRALRAEMERLVPEIRAIEGARTFDWYESVRFGPTAKRPDRECLRAGSDRSGGDAESQVTLVIEVGTKTSLVPTCSGLTGINRCTEIRKLPGGAIAYLKRYSIPETLVQGTGVTLDRPDGVRINVWNGTISEDGQQPTPLDLARVLEVAQGVTVNL
jgi:hypothetical protein